MKKLFYVLLTLMLLGACTTVPKELRFEEYEVKSKLVKMLVLSDLEMEAINSFRTNNAEYFNSIGLLDINNLNIEEVNKTKIKPYLKQCILNKLFTNSSEDQQFYGHLVYKIDKVKNDPDPLNGAGLLAHSFLGGSLALLGIPWASFYYDTKVSIEIYSFDGDLIKTYTEDLKHKQVSGLYYGYNDLTIPMLDNIMNSLYKQIEPDIPELNKQLLAEKVNI